MRYKNTNTGFLCSTAFYISVLAVLFLTFSVNANANPDAVGAIENNLKTNIHIVGEADPSTSIIKRMEQLHVPGLSIAVVHNGKIDWAKGYGIAMGETEVDTNTLFQAGSISKPVAALAALKLVEEGKLDLDADVNNYLKQWTIEDDLLSNNKPLTLRHLLTHTGGLTVHGFPGYPTGSKIPSTAAVLNGEGNTDKVEIDQEPGSNWRYSGGGYTVMQKMVEDVTGLPFSEYIDNQILSPIGMTSSTYQHVLPDTLKLRASAAYDYEGNMFAEVYNDYPEKAAAGLWTTPTDLAIYMMHLQAIMAGEKGVLEKSTVEAMFTKHQEDWGLGPSMSEVSTQLVFEHGGKNLGFTNYFKAFVNKGEGMIVMSNGDNGGQINGEVMTAISEYYDLGTDSRLAIDAVALPLTELRAFTGSYKLSTDVGYDGDYILQLVLIDEQLRMMIPDEDEYFRLVPIDEEKFISTFSGSPFIFGKDDDGEVDSVLVSDTYQYEKIM